MRLNRHKQQGLMAAGIVLASLCLAACSTNWTNPFSAGEKPLVRPKTENPPPTTAPAPVTPAGKTPAAEAPAKPETPVTEAKESAESPVSGMPLRIQLAKGATHIKIAAPAKLRYTAGAGKGDLPAGTYTITVTGATPAQQRFHVFGKTFKPAEKTESDAYLADWRARGYQPERMPCGRRFKTDQGTPLDTRLDWISLARCATESEASAIKTKLETQDVWAWIRPELMTPGGGQAQITDASGKVAAKGPIPLKLTSDQPVTVADVDTGYWRAQKADRSYAGVLDIAVGPDGKLELYETVVIEDYLCGVLPSEMPASWPQEALKAQAVAARSNVVADLIGKHHLEGFDFCCGEHCRVYGGAGACRETTNRAVKETAGEVAALGGRVTPTLFSANCGGWTENNDTVWSSPPDPALRGVADAASKANPAPSGPAAYGIAKWLKSAPAAYCRADEKNYRWKRHYTVQELTAAVNKQHPVGTVRSVELGPRGAGGRLKSVKITGSKKTVTVSKDLPIRKVFGDLPSTLFIIEQEPGGDGPKGFQFIGGGRGHGVGMCQHGACGMANAGVSYRDIIGHYFNQSAVVRVQ